VSMLSSSRRPQLQTLHARALLQRNIRTHTRADPNRRLARAEPDGFVVLVAGLWHVKRRHSRAVPQRLFGSHRQLAVAPSGRSALETERIRTVRWSQLSPWRRAPEDAFSSR
jgi:hypothetical protein